MPEAALAQHIEPRTRARGTLEPAGTRRSLQRWQMFAGEEAGQIRCCQISVLSPAGFDRRLPAPRALHPRAAFAVTVWSCLASQW
jgi:hypothetical protein